MWFEIIKKPIVALAPLADLTDGPFSQICREVAGDDFVIFREMISAEAVVRGNEKTLAKCAFAASERPVVVQIFGASPERMAEAAKIIYDRYKPDGIDINMGCPVPKVAAKTKAGAALLKYPELAGEIVRAIKAANLPIAISVKTRLGWSGPDEILSFAKIIEAAGADLLTVHGRTKTLGYAGAADWEMIGRVKKILNIPLIANGDIDSAAAAAKCLKITGADGVMIGRAALGNPWVLRLEETKISRDEKIKIILRHADLHEKRYGEDSMVTFRKHLAAYFKSWQGVRQIRAKLMQVKTRAELSEILKKIPPQ